MIVVRRLASGFSMPRMGLRARPRFLTAQLNPLWRAVIASRFVVAFQPLWELSQAVTWEGFRSLTFILPYLLTKDWMKSR